MKKVKRGNEVGEILLHRKRRALIGSTMMLKDALEGILKDGLDQIAPIPMEALHETIVYHKITCRLFSDSWRTVYTEYGSTSEFVRLANKLDDIMDEFTHITWDLHEKSLSYGDTKRTYSSKLQVVVATALGKIAEVRAAYTQAEEDHVSLDFLVA